MSLIALTPMLPPRTLEFSVPDSSQCLKYGDTELVYCGPGPADASAAYLDGATGDVVVLFEARLLAIKESVALFEPINDSLQGPRRYSVVLVGTSNIEGLIWVNTRVLLGPVRVLDNGHLEAAAAWPLKED